MKKILLAAAVVLLGAGGLVYWGARFANKTVHDQLAAQRIYFPKDAASGLPDSLRKYGGQQVDTGDKARAYAEYIKGHIDKATGGKTYSEISTEAMKNPGDTKLAGLRVTAFQGETLRGILLNAWGWGLIGTIALYASYAMFVTAIIVVIIAFYSANRRTTKQNLPTRKRR
jgi:hypothetical protein